MASETIEDVVREMREKNPRKEYPAEYGYGEVPNEMRDLADRIDAVAKQMEIQRIADIERECAKVKAECEDENSRLRDALKRLYEVAKNRMPHEPTLVEIEAMYMAEKAIKESEAK